MIFCAEKKLSVEAEETLAYLIHDKAHVFVKHDKHRDMEEVFDVCSESTELTLYRGVSEEELQTILGNRPIDYYPSFSEDANVAACFGKVIQIQGAAKAFNYWRHMVDSFAELKLQNFDEFDAVDGDFMIESLEQEREWILPFGLELNVVDQEKLIFKI